MRALDHSRLNFSGGEGGHHFWPLVPWETGADGKDERSRVDAFVSGVSGALSSRLTSSTPSISAGLQPLSCKS
jgi:hypothetical protein